MSLIKKNSGKEKERKNEIEKGNSNSRRTFLDEKKLHRFVVGNESKRGKEGIREDTASTHFLDVCVNNECRLINIFTGKIRSLAGNKHKVTILQIATRMETGKKAFLLALLLWLVCLSQCLAYFSFTLGVPANKPFNSSYCVKARIRSTEAMLMSLRK